MSQLPALDAAVAYAMQGGQRYGPMPLQQVIDAVRGGQSPPDTPVWWEGAGDWTPFEQVPELSAAVWGPGGAPAAAPAGSPPAGPGPAAAPPSDMSPAEVEELEALFTEQVETSWRHFKRVDFARRLDEVLLGALITATLGTGQVLIDLSSTGTDHFLRFEHPGDRSRTTVGMTHLTPSAVEGEVLGHHASVVIGWGQRVQNAGEVITAIREEIKSSLIQTPEPGTVTIDGDVTSGYAYTQIDLIWSLDELVAPDYTVDAERMTKLVAAAVHSLRKYWYGRFTPAQG